MAEPLIIIGAGGFGRETLDVVEAINAAAEQPVWDVIGVVDDAPSERHLSRLTARGYSHLGSLAEVKAPEKCAYIVAIGSPAVRAQIAERVDAVGGRWATLVHPTAVVGSRPSLGAGTVVCSGVLVSTNVRLGAHTHLNPGAIIGHDSELGDFVSVNPGAVVSGEVIVEERVLVGASATILQGLRVGTEAVVGASACVTRDVASGTTVVGVPAR